MSRPISPLPGATNTATGHNDLTLPSGDSKPASYLGAGTAGIDHADQPPPDSSYLTTDTTIDHNNADDRQRPDSQMSQSATYIPSRGGTLKKKASLNKGGSLRRNGSRRSSYAGSVRSMKLGEKEKYEPAEYNSAFYCPVPTTSSPTELLANRFQAWRKVLKDLITYFRDLHKSHESRSKTLLSASNVINNVSMPSDFLSTGGIADAAAILREFHKQAINEGNKARDLESEVIQQLTGLRSDLSQKIKEIKSLSGDFKNSVHKEQENTRKAVNSFQDALGMVDQDAAAAAGKGDPFLMKLGVERQLERQIEEENYLHRAFLNLEASGRELESIVVGEIQKAYNVLAGILKRDGDSNYETAEKLKEGPLAMSRDHEWDAFVTNNTNMVDPRQPLRQVRNITYQGKEHPAAIEVKSGMLERKSKYLKNYTPGWYILSPTHLHEFKSADQIPFQAPVMSLYLPEQKLGSHSEPGSSSHKFMLKGRQTGSMHRGHTWIFRAETHDTMMAWFSDIRELTEKRGEARNEFVRRTHARSVSRGSQRAASIGSGDSQMDEDEADKIAFSGEQSVRGVPLDHAQEGSVYSASGAVGTGVTGDDARSDAGWRPPQRPQPGGRFPSEVNVTRGLQAPLSPSSGDSGDEHDREAIAAASALPGSAMPFVAATSNQQSDDSQQFIGPAKATVYEQPTSYELPAPATNTALPSTDYTAGDHPRVTANPTGAEVAPDTQSQYREWIGTAGAGLAGAGAGALGASAIQKHTDENRAPESSMEEMSSVNPAIPAEGYSSPPIVTAMPSSSSPQQQQQQQQQQQEQPDIRAPNPPTGITASIYQATTMPHSSETPGVSRSLAAGGPSILNGTLISGTDIRAPGGTSFDYTLPKPEVDSISSSVPTANAPVASAFATSTSSTRESVRPSPVHTKSIQTISDLHIPGEYPKSDTTPPRSA